jgi:hypothetical protein
MGYPHPLGSFAPPPFGSKGMGGPISTKGQTLWYCSENPIYVLPGKELRGLSPNFHIHVSVSDLYIPRIGPHIFLQQNRQTDGSQDRSTYFHAAELTDQCWEYINRSQTHECGKLGMRPRNSFFGNIFFEFLMFVSAVYAYYYPSTVMSRDALPLKDSALTSPFKIN